MFHVNFSCISNIKIIKGHMALRKRGVTFWICIWKRGTQKGGVPTLEETVDCIWKKFCLLLSKIVYLAIHMKIKLGSYREFTVFIKLCLSFVKAQSFIQTYQVLSILKTIVVSSPPFPHAMNLYEFPTLTTLWL